MTADLFYLNRLLWYNDTMIMELPIDQNQETLKEKAIFLDSPVDETKMNISDVLEFELKNKNSLESCIVALDLFVGKRRLDMELFLDKNKEKLIEKVLVFLRKYKEEGEMNAVSIEKIKRMTVGVFEICVFDNMVVDNKKDTQKRRYARDNSDLNEKYEDRKGNKTEAVFLKNSEINMVRNRFDLSMLKREDYEVKGFENIEDLLLFLDALDKNIENKTHIRLNSDISYSEYKRLEKYMKNREFPNGMVISMEVKYNDEVSSLNVLNLKVVPLIKFTVFDISFENQTTFRNKIPVCNTHKNNIIGIESPLTKQALLKSFLDNGLIDYNQEVSPMGIEILNESKPTLENKDIDEFVRNIDQDCRKISSKAENQRKRLIVSLNNIGDEKTLKFYKKHVKFYEDFFEQKNKKPEVFLASSGAISNDIMINLIKNNLNENDEVFMDDGWYFENIPAIENSLKRSKNIKNAKALFIGITDANGQLSEEEYFLNMNRNIEQIILNAEKDPEKKYFILLDQTFDPLYKIFDKFKKIPKNLEIIETISFSKHQRGQTNYFFGAISYFGETNRKEEIQDLLDNSKGKLKPREIENFPRITSKEIEENQKKLKILKLKFSEGLEAGQKDIPKHLRWDITNNKYCIYLKPPIYGLMEELLKNSELLSEKEISLLKRFLEIKKYGKSEIKKGSEDETINILKKVGIKFEELFGGASDEVAKNKFKNLELGDSFGLHKNRLSMIQNDLFSFDGYKLKTHVFENSATLIAHRVRLGMGLKEDENEQSELGNIIGNILSKKLKAVQIQKEKERIKQKKYEDFEKNKSEFYNLGITDEFWKILDSKNIKIFKDKGVWNLDVSKQIYKGDTDLYSGRDDFLEFMELDSKRIKSIKILRPDGGFGPHGTEILLENNKTGAKEKFVFED